MTEDVAGPVDARTLAVPEREDAVVLALAKKTGLLRTPACRRRQFLVEAGLELDLGLLQPALRLPQLLIEAAKGDPR